MIKNDWQVALSQMRKASCFHEYGGKPPKHASTSLHSGQIGQSIKRGNVFRSRLAICSRPRHPCSNLATCNTPHNLCNRLPHPCSNLPSCSRLRRLCSNLASCSRLYRLCNNLASCSRPHRLCSNLASCSRQRRPCNNLASCNTPRRPYSNLAPCNTPRRLCNNRLSGNSTSSEHYRLLSSCSNSRRFLWRRHIRQQTTTRRGLRELFSLFFLLWWLFSSWLSFRFSVFDK